MNNPQLTRSLKFTLRFPFVKVVRLFRATSITGQKADFADLQDAQNYIDSRKRGHLGLKAVLSQEVNPANPYPLLTARGKQIRVIPETKPIKSAKKTVVRKSRAKKVS